MSYRLKKLIFLGVIIELLLFVFMFLLNDSLGQVFRLSARYSGRISFSLYTIMFYHFIDEKSKGKSLQNTYWWGVVFCVLHLIHFGFLSGSVFINEQPIIPYKLVGGFLAYLAIVIYPFFMRKIKRLSIHLFYFYYVGIVMAMTFLARIRGEFEGAPESPFHYFGILIITLFFLHSIKIFFNSKKITSRMI